MSSCGGRIPVASTHMIDSLCMRTLLSKSVCQTITHILMVTQIKFYIKSHLYYCTPRQQNKPRQRNPKGCQQQSRRNDSRWIQNRVATTRQCHSAAISATRQRSHRQYVKVEDHIFSSSGRLPLRLVSRHWSHHYNCKIWTLSRASCNAA